MATQRRTTLFLCIPAVLSALAIAAPFLRRSGGETRVDPEKFAMELPVILERTPAAERMNLLLKYADSPQYGIRLAAIEAVGEQKDSRAVAALEHAYLDSASLIRQRVLEEMYSLDPKRGVRLLLSGLRDDDLWVRDSAAMRITSYARSHEPGIDRTIVPSLIRALDDPSDAVVSFAMTSLKHLTGNRWTISSRASTADRAKVIARWKAWWIKAGAAVKEPDVAAVQPTRTDPAPPFAFSDIDGKSISLDSQRGRMTLLNFWGTWCGPCRLEIPELVHLDREYRDKGLDVIGIALSERNGADGLRKWCGDHGITYRQSLAQDSVLETFDHIHEVPVSILIDRQGRVRRRWDGERDFATFRAAIEACDRN